MQSVTDLHGVGRSHFHKSMWAMAIKNRLAAPSSQPIVVYDALPKAKSSWSGMLLQQQQQQKQQQQQQQQMLFIIINFAVFIEACSQMEKPAVDERPDEAVIINAKSGGGRTTGG